MVNIVVFVEATLQVIISNDRRVIVEKTAFHRNASMAASLL